MKTRIINRIIALLLTMTGLASCGLDLQENYDYQASVSDPHVNMTAWEFFKSRPDLFSEFMQAVEYADMEDYYTQTENMYTYLALSNTAMQSFRESNFPGAVSIIECDKEAVRELLLYHIVDGEYSSYGQLQVDPMFVLTLLPGEYGLMTMSVRKNPWQAAVGQIVINSTGSNSNSPMRTAKTSNILPVNGVIHVFDNYCYYKK